MGIGGKIVAKLIKLGVNKLAFTLCQKIGHASKTHITNLSTHVGGCIYVCALQSPCLG